MILNWNKIWQKVLVAVLTVVALSFLGLVYTTYTEAQETPERVTEVEERLDNHDIQIARLDTLMTEVVQQMKADSVAQGAIMEGINKLIGIAEAKGDNDDDSP